MGAAALAGGLLAILLFLVIPTTLVGLLGQVIELGRWPRVILEGLLKIAIFVVYLYLCTRMSEIHRMFQYHGAEHKTIACYEAGLPLEVENVRLCSRFHPRCGTSFLLVVICISILCGTLIRADNTFVRMGLHLLMLPVIVAISYEFNRLVGRYNNRLTRILTAPGMWMQHFTTNEPDDSMIEVAIRALEEVIPEEAGTDQW